jgi:hypothetical protein
MNPKSGEDFSNRFLAMWRFCGTVISEHQSSRDFSLDLFTLNRRTSAGDEAGRSR